MASMREMAATASAEALARARAMSSLFAAVVLVLVLVSSSANGGSVNDCHGVRYAYRERGLDLKDVPRQPRQGSQLQICPRGLTCCTEEMERKLRSVSRENYKKSMQAAANSMQRLFNNRANKFDEYFTDLLATSKLKFHKLFHKTYGIIYERNSDVFIDFFRDLEDYYDHGEVDLEDALRKFFSRLYQRMFTVFNAQHSFDYPYLSCVSQTMKKLQPFGDVPKKLTEQLRRSFVATRTFAQALMQGKHVVNKILKIDPKEQCVDALTKMSSCPACQGIPEILPCPDYCVNVMKGCLAYHAELGDSWDNFIESVQSLSERLVGPFDIEDVVDPIGVSISEGIMNFQNSGYEITGKVFQDCGTPRLQKRQAADGYEYNNYNPSHYSGSDRGEVGVEETKLKSLVKEIKVSVEDAKGFWTRLPYAMCRSQEIPISDGDGRRRSSSSSSGSSSGGGRRGQRHSKRQSKSQEELDTDMDTDMDGGPGRARSNHYNKGAGGNRGGEQQCWNGRDAGKYANSVVRDGLASQESNPEVPVDISRPDIDINEQIFALKLITKKLESAYNGQPVEWSSSRNQYDRGPNSYYDSRSEGSGDGCDPYSDDEDCYDYSEYEGSGSGEDDYYSAGGYDDDDTGDDPSEENYPPWMTTTTKASVVKTRTEDDDIKLDEPRSTSTSLTTKTTSTATAGASGVAPPSPLSAVRALLYFAVPLATCWLGNLFAVPSPSW